MKVYSTKYLFIILQFCFTSGDFEKGGSAVNLVLLVQFFYFGVKLFSAAKSENLGC